MCMIDFLALKVSFVIQELTSAQPPVPAQALIVIIKRYQQKRHFLIFDDSSSYLLQL